MRVRSFKGVKPLSKCTESIIMISVWRVVVVLYVPSYYSGQPKKQLAKRLELETSLFARFVYSTRSLALPSLHEVDPQKRAPSNSKMKSFDPFCPRDTLCAGRRQAIKGGTFLLYCWSSSIVRSSLAPLNHMKKGKNYVTQCKDWKKAAQVLTVNL